MYLCMCAYTKIDDGVVRKLHVEEGVAFTSITTADQVNISTDTAREHTIHTHARTHTHAHTGAQGLGGALPQALDAVVGIHVCPGEGLKARRAGGFRYSMAVVIEKKEGRRGWL
jgi:hypothetical protein